MHRREITAREAASRLGVTPQTIRNRVRAGKLDGRQDARGVWHVSAAAVDRSIPPPVPAELVRTIGQLADEVAALRDRADGGDRLAAALERERDRYRADAAAAREAALILAGNVRELDAATRRLLGALEGQTNALVQLLTPSTPEDLTGG